MENGNTKNEGALAPIRVIDFTTMMAGPYCTRYLADLGAEVIKIESASGDYLRSQAPLRDGNSTYFGHLNAGKRSLQLDLKDPADQQTASDLIAEADVVVENFRPGVMDRFGLDYASVSRRNPRVVYCAISGFGQSGPGAERPAYAQIIHASCGFDLAFTGYQDEMTRPPNSVFFMADVLAATYGMSAINAALYQRERTGRGQFIDLSLMEGMMNMMVYEVQEAQFPADRSRPKYRPLRTTDGYVMIVPNTQRNFEQLARAMGHPEWLEDPRLATVQARYEHFPDVMATLESWTSTRTAADCEATLSAASVPCARYRTVREAMEDPQFEARGTFARATDGAGAFLVPNLPFRMSDARVSAEGSVPELGEFNREGAVRKP